LWVEYRMKTRSFGTRPLPHSRAVQGWLGEFTGRRLQPRPEAPPVPVFIVVGTTAFVVEFGAGLAAADTGPVLAVGVSVPTLGGG